MQHHYTLLEARWLIRYLHGNSHAASLFDSHDHAPNGSESMLSCLDLLRPAPNLQEEKFRTATLFVFMLQNFALQSSSQWQVAPLIVTTVHFKKFPD